MKQTSLHVMCATVLLFSTGAAVARAGGPDGDVVLVRKLVEQAEELLEKGDYAGTIEAIREAEKHSRAPSLTVISAEAHEKLGKLADAQRLYQSVASLNLDLLKPPPNVNRWRWLPAQKEAQEFATAELLKLAPRVPHLTVSVTGADLGVVRVTVDGETFDAAHLGREVPWNPGKHTIVAEIPGKEKATTEVELKEGDRKSVTLALNRPPPKFEWSMPTEAAVAYGVGGAGLLVSMIAGGIAAAEADKREAECLTKGADDSDTTCPGGYLQPMLAAAHVSTTGLFIGIAGIGLGTTFLLRSLKRPVPSPVSVAVNPGFISLKGTF